MRTCWRSTRRSARWLSRDAAASATLAFTHGIVTRRLRVRFSPYGDSMNETNTTVEQFFERYAAALLARDEQTMGRMYAVPSLILFPGRGTGHRVGRRHVVVRR